MSIRAMNWAMAARTDGVSAQCVLYIVADTANEHGVSIHADPDYIATRTRQSRATVFRRLKELEAAGALTRFKRFRDDGAPVYEIRLHLDVDVDYDAVPDDDGSAQDIESESQIETQSGSQPETGKVSPVRQAESHSCDSKSPSKNPKDSPQAPQRGDEHAPSAMEGEAGETADPEGWSDFKNAWEADKVPISRVTLTKPIFAALGWPDERRKVIRAARATSRTDRGTRNPAPKCRRRTSCVSPKAGKAG
jgi:DNA-binding Lrp family transcriptional regulator